jgi:hypothetical protein
LPDSNAGHDESQEGAMAEPDYPRCGASLRYPDNSLGLGAIAPGTRCGDIAFHEVADILLCDRHYRRVLEWAEKAARWANSIVYYVRRPDGMIKIGTSRAAGSRLDSIARKHGRLLLMAFHAGARAEEAAVHRQFRALHIGGEWHRPELPLLEHIAKVRKTMSNLVPEDDDLPERMNRLEFSRLVRATKAAADPAA